MTSKTKRIAWVTGGGSGIGLAGAEALAADGWAVAISGRRRDVLADAAKRIGDKAPGTVDIFTVDVARVDDVQAVARSILAKQGQIDLLVNNAGLNVPKRSWKELEIAGWDQIVELNLSGVLYAMHAVLPAMRERKSGSGVSSLK
jgi:NADP-dependent 3-hydroxy acid dehydrogenase YdfG